MKLFDVYPLYPIQIVRGSGCKVYDDEGVEYLDFYGGHAVISVGHSHPHYINAIKGQIDKIGFYSNSIQNKLQVRLANLLGLASEYDDYQLFLINSGAEANENALKLASFHTGKSKVIAFKKGFHGRTSAAVNITDNEALIAPINRGFARELVELGDIAAVEKILMKGDVAAIIVEGIQGIAGIYQPPRHFLQELQNLAQRYKAILILDEIQSGYGRSGHFFAHQA
ncbi:MAG: aspartate aminotransferase family protein, partial [Saprospiraceae bacterium]|nr:aspartate aminotransferase family protein [Saprospiraceae bacterium]